MILVHAAILGALAGAQATVDTTFAVPDGARLRLDASAGSVSVRVWDELAVRVVATPRGGTSVRIAESGSLIRVFGIARSQVDEATYVVTIPRRMSVTLETGDVAIDIEGVEGDVSARNHSGGITARGAKGQLRLASTLGEVSVSNSSGRVSARSLSAAIRMTDVTGDVVAEGSAQHIYLTRVTSSNLTATTVGGVIRFTGPLLANGRYSFSSHSGSVWLFVPAPVNATVYVGTASGGFSSVYPFTREEGPRRGRFIARLGTGSAMVDVETFSGGIALSRPES